MRGFRPNSRSKGERFSGKDGSGKVRLTQHAGETYFIAVDLFLDGDSLSPAFETDLVR